MKKKIRELYQNISKVSFWTCLSISVILLITSFFLPPTGEINSSVMVATSELFAFATLGTVIDGIHRGSDISVKKGEIEVNINNPDKQNENLG